ncbi:hypothetical protein ACRYCC_34310 [Actinomadura scrupuli]|uniref:hypothetical protein n=1 Tax=Actinomadura scrupuli TaxID=559629 RepID=UPI003D9871AA
MKILAVAPLVLALALAGCSSGKGDPSPSASAGTPGTQELLTLGRQMAQCARTHGYPNFPDPTIDNSGDLRFNPPGGGDEMKRTFGALESVPECKTVLDRMVSTSKRREKDDPQNPGPKDVPALKRFAQCLRQHGLPEWPDPKADGSFPLQGTPVQAEGKSQRMLQATDACKQYWSKRIAVS